MNFDEDECIELLGLPPWNILYNHSAWWFCSQNCLLSLSEKCRAFSLELTCGRLLVFPSQVINKLRCSQATESYITTQKNWSTTNAAARSNHERHIIENNPKAEEISRWTGCYSAKRLRSFMGQLWRSKGAQICCIAALVLRVHWGSLQRTEAMQRLHEDKGLTVS